MFGDVRLFLAAHAGVIRLKVLSSKPLGSLTDFGVLARLKPRSREVRYLMSKGRGSQELGHGFLPDGLALRSVRLDGNL